MTPTRSLLMRAASLKPLFASLTLHVGSAVRSSRSSRASAWGTLSRRHHRLCVRGLAIGAVASLAAAVFAWDGHRGLLTARAAQAAIAVQAPPALGSGRAAPAAPRSGPGFLQALPVVAPAGSLIRALQESGQREGVPVLEIEVTDRPADARSPGLTEVRVTLRGSYPRLRAVVAGMAGDPTAPLLRRLALQRSDAGPDVQAVIDWWLPTRMPS